MVDIACPTCGEPVSECHWVREPVIANIVCPVCAVTTLVRIDCDLDMLLAHAQAQNADRARKRATRGRAKGLLR